jgi:hypothetical protein
VSHWAGRLSGPPGGRDSINAVFAPQLIFGRFRKFAQPHLKINLREFGNAL